MNALTAFTKKELLAQLRGGKLLILGIVFLLFGIMNPAIAKLTPWLMETLSDTLAESGMTVTSVEVDALTSWVQFFKNIPLGLIIFILVESSIFTLEYGTGTLIPPLTKGLDRWKATVSKALVLAVLWSACYWLCFAVTCGYNAYFWDNSIAAHLDCAVTCWWLFGLWVVSLTVLFSCLATANSSVLLGTGGSVLAVYLLSLIPKLSDYAPTLLMDGSSLICGAKLPADYSAAITVTAVLTALAFALSLPVFNRKQI